MPFDWRAALFGASPPAAPPELAAAGFGSLIRPVGHTVELLRVTPHGGDLHLVEALVDGEPFRNYVPTGDIRGEEPEIQRRVIARRVRALVAPHDSGPSLTGKEVGLP